MSVVAECGGKKCSGTLEAVIDGSEKVNGELVPKIAYYVCESCRSVWGTTQVVNGKRVGVDPKGKLDNRDDFDREREEWRTKVDALQAKLDTVAIAVEGKDNALAKEIRAILAEAPTDGTPQMGVPETEEDVA